MRAQSLLRQGLSELGSAPLHPFLFATLFVAYLVERNINEAVPLRDVLDAWAVVLAVVSAVLGTLVLTTRQIRVPAVLTSIAVIWAFAFGDVRAIVSAPGRGEIVLVVWATAGVTAVWLAWRFRDRLSAGNPVLNVVAAILLALNLGPIVPHYVRAATLPRFVPELVTDDIPNEIAEVRPDIFYIILDRYPSAETLASTLYDYDNSPFIDELRRRGFYVADRSHANYLTTALSVASSLNMDYLDMAAMSAAARGPDNWRPVYTMLGSPLSAPAALKAQGYTYELIPSWYWPTAQGFGVDRRFRASSFSEFAEVLRRSTAPGAALDMVGIGAGESLHIEHALFQFDRLVNYPRSDEPEFIFAHILLPHPPIAFGPNGPLPPHEWADGDDAPREKFLGQLEYTNRRVLEVLDHLLFPSDPDPPVVIIQADEGPRPPVPVADWRYAQYADAQQKFGILNAYYLPHGGDSDLYPTITPVNTFRIVLNRYFGTGYALLEDFVYAFRDDDHIYENVELSELLGRDGVSEGDTLPARYDVQPPAALVSGVPVNYPVTIENTGSETWRPTGERAVGLVVGFKPDPASPVVAQQRFQLPEAVAPGESVTISVDVRPPDAAGAYQLEHRLAQGIGWSDDAHVRTVDVTSSPEVWADVLGAVYRADAPTSWITGEVISYRIDVRNVGTYTWNASGTYPVKLGVHMGGESDIPGDGWVSNVYFELPEDVPPGESAMIKVFVRAPDSPGTYVLRHRMDKAGIGWFDELSATRVTVEPDRAATMRLVAFLLVAGIAISAAAALAYRARRRGPDARRATN